MSMRPDLLGGALRVLWLLLVVLLAACAGEPRRPEQLAALRAQADREQQLRAIAGWALQGRVAISDGRDGGSGSVDWRRQGERSEFELRAPVTRQSWRLQVDADGARLDGLEGGPRHGADAETLVRDALRWELPLGDLAAWVRGARGPGRARIEFADDGLPALIEQRGWRVEYRGWDRGHQPPLPRRVFASRGEHRVKLAISRWSAGPVAPP